MGTKAYDESQLNRGETFGLSAPIDGRASKKRFGEFAQKDSKIFANYEFTEQIREAMEGMMPEGRPFNKDTKPTAKAEAPEPT